MKTCCRFKTGNCVAAVNPQVEGEFAKDAKRKDGLTPHCKSCLKSYREKNRLQRNEVIKKWRENNPEKMRAYRVKSANKNLARMRKWRDKNRLMSLYKISNEDWKAMFDSQNGKCKICSAHASTLNKTLQVDHCHTTEKVRGLLCSACNKALGLFKDNIQTIEKALEYLKGDT